MQHAKITHAWSDSHAQSPEWSPNCLGVPGWWMIEIGARNCALAFWKVMISYCIYPGIILFKKSLFVQLRVPKTMSGFTNGVAWTCMKQSGIIETPVQWLVHAYTTKSFNKHNVGSYLFWSCHPITRTYPLMFQVPSHSYNPTQQWTRHHHRVPRFRYTPGKALRSYSRMTSYQHVSNVYHGQNSSTTFASWLAFRNLPNAPRRSEWTAHQTPLISNTVFHLITLRHGPPWHQPDTLNRPRVASPVWHLAVLKVRGRLQLKIFGHLTLAADDMRDFGKIMRIHVWNVMSCHELSWHVMKCHDNNKILRVRKQNCADPNHNHPQSFTICELR